MADYLMKIVPTLDKSQASTIERGLGNRLLGVTKKFGRGLKTAFKFAFTGGAIGMALGALLNPLKEANEVLDNMLAKADNIATRATQGETSNASYLKLSTAAQAKGLDEASFTQIYTKFQSLLGKAKLGEDNILSEFKNEKDTAQAFYRTIQWLKTIKDKDQQAALTGELFGDRSIGKLAAFLDSDIENNIKEIFKGKTDKTLDTSVQKLSDLEKMQALKKANRDIDDLVAKSKVIDGSLITAQDKSERAKNARTTKQLTTYESLTKIEQTVEELKTTVLSLATTLTPLLLPAAQALSAIAGYLEKLTPYIQTGVNWLEKIFTKLSSGISGWWKGK